MRPIFATLSMETINMTELTYNGFLIHEKGEMLSLTDMWKAAGANQSKRPVEWLRHEGTIEFIEYVNSNLNAGKSCNEGNMGNTHFEIIQTVRGGNQPGTWAHWQIGLAYAKYLSPKFHIWCNTVVRAYMEGKLIEVDEIDANGRNCTDIDITEDEIATKRQLVTEARRTFGIRSAREMWFKLGLPTVPSMYREISQNNDPIEEFIRTVCVVTGKDKHAATPADLFAGYSRFAKQEGKAAFGLKTFSRRFPDYARMEWHNSNGDPCRFWKAKSGTTVYRGIYVKDDYRN